MHKRLWFHYFLNAGYLYIHACLKVHLCLKMRFSTSFDITWYAEAAIYATHEKWLSKTDNARQSGIEWKLSLCKWHTFWMAQCLICCFILMLYYIEKKWILMRYLATILPLKFNLSGKFLRFNTIDRSMEMLKISWISQFSVKMKNCKTFYEIQTGRRLKGIIQPTLNLPGKILLRLWNKNFPAEIYRNIQTFASRKRVSVSENVLHCTVSWYPETASSTSRNSAVQMLFLTPDRNMFSGRFMKKGSEGVLAVLGDMLFSMSRELRFVK